MDACGCHDPVDCGECDTRRNACDERDWGRDERDRADSTSGPCGCAEPAPGAVKDPFDGGRDSDDIGVETLRPWSPIVPNPCGSGGLSTRREGFFIELPPLALGGVPSRWSDPLQSHATGEVTFPICAPPPGGFPCVFIQHGYIWLDGRGDGPACRVPTPTALRSAQPPSYQGYRYLANALAAHGYCVVSLDVRFVIAWNALVRQRTSGGLPACQVFYVRARHMLRAMLGFRLGRGPVPIDRNKIALIGHSNGGAAALVAQHINQSFLGGMFGVQAVVGLDPNTSWPTSADGDCSPLLPAGGRGPLNLQGADYLVFPSECDISFDQDLGRIVAISQGAAGVTRVEGRNFHHQNFNTVWEAELAHEYSGLCPGRTCTLGPSPTSRWGSNHWNGARQQRVVVCYTTALLLWRFSHHRQFYEYLEWKRPLPPGLSSAAVRTVQHWPTVRSA